MKGKTVLVIDDDKFLLDMYGIKFKEAGAEVLLSPSAPGALAMVHDGLSPDVILLDIVMPEMNGLELLEKLRKESNAKKSAIIVLSNQSQPADIESAKKLGIDGYVVKASTIPSEVLDIVGKILTKKHG